MTFYTLRDPTDPSSEEALTPAEDLAILNRLKELKDERDKSVVGKALGLEQTEESLMSKAESWVAETAKDVKETALKAKARSQLIQDLKSSKGKVTPSMPLSVLNPGDEREGSLLDAASTVKSIVDVTELLLDIPEDLKRLQSSQRKALKYIGDKFPRLKFSTDLLKKHTTKFLNKAEKFAETPEKKLPRSLVKFAAPILRGAIKIAGPIGKAVDVLLTARDIKNAMPDKTRDTLDRMGLYATQDPLANALLPALPIYTKASELWEGRDYAKENKSKGTIDDPQVLKNIQHNTDMAILNQERRRRGKSMIRDKKDVNEYHSEYGFETDPAKYLPTLIKAREMAHENSTPLTLNPLDFVPLEYLQAREVKKQEAKVREEKWRNSPAVMTSWQSPAEFEKEQRKLIEGFTEKMYGPSPLQQRLNKTMAQVYRENRKLPPGGTVKPSAEQPFNFDVTNTFDEKGMTTRIMRIATKNAVRQPTGFLDFDGSMCQRPAGA